MVSYLSSYFMTKNCTSGTNRKPHTYGNPEPGEDGVSGPSVHDDGDNDDEEGRRQYDLTRF